MREMKNSNIIWLGSIPSDWNILRVKNTSWLKGRIGWDGLKSEEFTDEGPYLITGTDFSDGKVNWDTCAHITEDRFSEDELLHIKEGDLLITKDGTIGKLAIVEGCPEKVSLNSGVMIIRNNSSWRYDQKFMYYILGSEVFTQWFESEQKPGSTIRHLYQHQFGEFRFPFPSLSEQRSIVSYLDKKCATIDEAIARRRQIIEKLEEYRMSKIADLVLLRDSHDRYETGNIWFETMPAGIKISSIKRHFSVKLGKMLCSSARDENDTLEPYYCAGDVHFDGMNYSDLKRMWFSQAEKKLNEVRNGDLLIVEGGAGAGGAFIVSQQVVPTYIQNSILRVRGTKTGSVRYLKYLIEHLVKNGYIGYACNTATFAHYTNDKVSDTPFPAIPIEIQEKIADELDSIDRGVQKLKTVNSQAIEKLEEYRKSIIYNAVTGKIDCREAV